MRVLADPFYEGPAQAHDGGLTGWLLDLGDQIAVVTAVFCWGPNEGWGLPLGQLKWWYRQSVRIEAKRRGV